jgi:hypothetical protein
MRSRIAIALFVLLATGAARAAGPLVVSGDAFGPGGEITDRSLSVEGGAAPTTQQILVIEHPPVAGAGYQVTGSVAYQEVAGEGYLEMWSEFPDGSRYFSRTLEASGPMAKLSGSSAGRAFVLPFFLQADSPRPTRLEVNVALPAGGRVEVRDLRFGGEPGAAAATGAWWSPQTAGLLGGAGGSVVGLLGAAIGTLCSLGRARHFVFAALWALAGSGVVMLAAGGAALALGQPYEVYYPLLLLGVLDPVLALSLLPTARKRYETIELRRMQAFDAR